MTTVILRSTLIWVGLFVLAFVNGAFREGLMKKVINIKEPLAHQLSCLKRVWTDHFFVGAGLRGE